MGYKLKIMTIKNTSIPQKERNARFLWTYLC